MALNSLSCADVPLSYYPLNHSAPNPSQNKVINV